MEAVAVMVMSMLVDRFHMGRVWALKNKRWLRRKSGGRRSLKMRWVDGEVASEEDWESAFVWK